MSSYGKDPDGPCLCPSPECKVGHHQPIDDGMRRLAEALSRAHVKYFHLFGVEPHGTIKQLLAMLELCPEAKSYIRLYEENRDRMLTD